MQRTCPKCGHRNEAATGGANEGCPKCGAIYAKATPGRASVSPRAALPFGHTRSGPGIGLARFAESVRAETLYPNFRAVANVGHWFGILAAVLIGGGALLAARDSGVSATVVGLAVAVLVALLSRAAREGGHMFADMADAVMRTAASRDE